MPSRSCSNSYRLSVLHVQPHKGSPVFVGYKLFCDPLQHL